MTNPEELPALFIGSSIEQVEVANTMQELLDDNFDVTVWTQGVFGLSQSNLDALIATAKATDFGVLICEADDVVVKRGEEGPSIRDNVIFELGLFMGALGPGRTFMVHSRVGPPGFPSDLHGITRVTYRPRRDGNLKAALGPACSEIRRAAKDALGVRDQVELHARRAVRSLITMAARTKEARILAEKARELGQVDKMRESVGQISVYLSTLEENFLLEMHDWQDLHPQALKGLLDLEEYRDGQD